MENRMTRASRWSGVVALAMSVLAVAWAGAALEGFDHSIHPVALLGARGVPNAQAFAWGAFVLPGVLAAWTAWDLRRRLPQATGWSARIGVQLVLLSTLAWIAMGFLPLDPQDLESASSRLHGTAWMAWCVAFVPGAALLGFGLASQPGWRRFALATLAAAGGVVLGGFVLGDWIAVGTAQRYGFACWLGWIALAGLFGWPARGGQSALGLR